MSTDEPEMPASLKQAFKNDAEVKWALIRLSTYLDIALTNDLLTGEPSTLEHLRSLVQAADDALDNKEKTDGC